MPTNRFPAKCTRCGGVIPAGEGFVYGGKNAEGWSVMHDGCIPKSVSTLPQFPVQVWRLNPPKLAHECSTIEQAERFIKWDEGRGPYDIRYDL